MPNPIIETIRTTLHLDPKVTTLDQLFVEQLKDLYSAETQLIEALPQMADAANAAELKSGFRTHLGQTREHAQRLEKVLKGMGEKPEGKKCQAMAGLIKEGNEVISENASPVVKDAGLIAAAQRVEHYEMAGYGTVRTFAELLGHRQVAALLNKTLQEEGATDKKLTSVARKLNVKVPQSLKSAKSPSKKSTAKSSAKTQPRKK